MSLTISECVYSVLSGAATVIAEVPAARIKVPGSWQGQELPYIEHVPVSVEPLRAHSGLKSGKKWTYQVNVYAETMGAAEDLAFIVVAAVDGVHQCGTPATDVINCQWIGGLWYAGRDPDNEVEHFVLQFEITQTAV